MRRARSIRHQHNIRLAVALLAAALLLSALSGCRSTRHIVITSTPPSSINTKIDTSVVRAPKLEPLPRAGGSMSFPEAVRRYRDSLAAATVAVVEVEITGTHATIRTPVGETVHRLPPKGETKTIRPDSTGAIQESVSGTPQEERTEIALPNERSAFDKFREMVSSLALVLVLLVVAVVVIAIIRATRK